MRALATWRARSRGRGGPHFTSAPQKDRDAVSAMGGPTILRQPDRASRDLRRPSGDRDRKRAPVRRIQKRKTHYLQIITFGLQRAAGPYRWANTMSRHSAPRLMKMGAITSP